VETADKKGMRFSSIIEEKQRFAKWSMSLCHRGLSLSISQTGSEFESCFTVLTRNVDGITFFWFCNFEIHGSKSFEALQRITFITFFMIRS